MFADGCLNPDKEKTKQWVSATKVSQVLIRLSVMLSRLDNHCHNLCQPYSTTGGIIIIKKNYTTQPHVSLHFEKHHGNLKQLK